MNSLKKVLFLFHFNYYFIKDYDDQTNINGFYDAFWFCIVTMTTVGYGDKTPKSLIGRILTTFLAFLANSIILPLPIAIIGRDVNEV